MQDDLENMTAAIVARFDCSPAHAARVAAWVLGESAGYRYGRSPTESVRADLVTLQGIEPAGAWVDDCARLVAREVAARMCLPADEPRAWVRQWAARKPYGRNR